MKKIKGVLSLKDMQLIYTKFKSYDICRKHKIKKELMLMPTHICKKCLDEKFKTLVK
jgi:hypothetical protein